MSTPMATTICVGWGLSGPEATHSGPFLFRGPLAAGHFRLEPEEADVQLVAPMSEWAGQSLDSADVTGDGVVEWLVGAENRDQESLQGVMRT